MNTYSEEIQSLPPPEHLVASLTKYKTHKCHKCGIGFREVTELRKHQFIDGQESAVCTCCNEVFSTHKGMKQHYGKMHAKHKPSRCATCKKRFRNKYALKFHIMQVHEQSTREACPRCHQEMYNGYSVKRHLIVCRGSDGA